MPAHGMPGHEGSVLACMCLWGDPEQNSAVLRRIEACTTVESCSRRACLAVARQAAIAPAMQASDSALVTSESLVASVTQVTSLARTGCVRSYA